MNEVELKKEVIKLVERNDLRGAIDLLKPLGSSQVVHIESQYASLIQDDIAGILSPGTRNQRRAEIRRAIIIYLNNMSQYAPITDGDPEPNVQTPDKERQLLWMNFALVFLLFTALLLMVVFIPKITQAQYSLIKILLAFAALPMAVITSVKARIEVKRGDWLKFAGLNGAALFGLVMMLPGLKPSSQPISLFVVDQNGGGVPDVEVYCANTNVSDNTNSNGQCDFDVPEEDLENMLRFQIRHNGIAFDTVVAYSKELVLRLPMQSNCSLRLAFLSSLGERIDPADIKVGLYEDRVQFVNSDGEFLADHKACDLDSLTINVTFEGRQRAFRIANKSLLQTVIVPVAATSQAPGAIIPPSPKPDADGILQIVVKRMDGAIVVGATVVCDGDTLQTDAAGRVEFRGLEVGKRYSVTAYSGDFFGNSTYEASINVDVTYVLKLVYN